MRREVIFFIGLLFNGRDEYIGEVFERVNGESYVYYYVFDYICEVGKECGVRIIWKNVFDFVISYLDMMNEIRDEVFERIRKEIDESDKRVYFVLILSFFCWGSGSVIGFMLSNLKFLGFDRVIIIFDDVFFVRRRIINDLEWFECFGENFENIKLIMLVMWCEDVINYVKIFVYELKKEGINVCYVF